MPNGSSENIQNPITLCHTQRLRRKLAARYLLIPIKQIIFFSFEILCLYSFKFRTGAYATYFGANFFLYFLNKGLSSQSSFRVRRPTQIKTGNLY